MKRLLAVVLLALLSAFLTLPVAAQTGTTTITIVAVPPSTLGTITPTPVHFYQSTAAPISFASSTNGFNNTCTATAGTTALPVVYSSTTNALTGTLSAAMTSTLGNLTITITCTPSALPPLSMLSPVTLPNAPVGVAYSQNLASLIQLSGGVPPYKFSLAPGASLPPGLSLLSSGIVSGTPSGAASSIFNFIVTDSSGS